MNEEMTESKGEHEA